MKLATNPTIVTSEAQPDIIDHIDSLPTYKNKDQGSPTLLSKRSHRFMSTASNKHIKQSSTGKIAKVGTVVKSSFNGKTSEIAANCNTKTRKYNMRTHRFRSKDISAHSTDFKLHELEPSDEEGSVTNSIRHKKNQKQQRRGSTREFKEALPPRTIDEDQEDEIIRILEQQQRQLLEQDPMKELEEALMDRTTASQNRR